MAAKPTIYKLNLAISEASFVERTMNWSLSISGDTVYVAAGEQECELVVTELV
ncbi:YaeQ family protein [Marinospirillum insulare]|uniref:Uncharacterized protein n=1 Tax=Marinospirillum insulare TaxID=217169 RepID=A0ABQ6A2C4_9GAMM|nr:YaeQ family protein [Marinospirillum insulare]GLR64259.1 hypothetical protein GCM10007878_16970 [Marinospirillum insulare]